MRACSTLHPVCHPLFSLLSDYSGFKSEYVRFERTSGGTNVINSRLGCHRTSSHLWRGSHAFIPSVVLAFRSSHASYYLLRG